MKEARERRRRREQGLKGARTRAVSIFRWRTAPSCFFPVLLLLFSLVSSA